MLIVADTGPLVSLLQLRLVFVLEELYPDFVLPGAVFAELQRIKQLHNFSAEINLLHSRVKTPIAPIVENVNLQLGELECISLCKELNADYLLIEDLEARKFAIQLGIECFGIIALLLKAKDVGLIKEIKPLLFEMKNNGRFLSDKLIHQTLSYAREI